MGIIEIILTIVAWRKGWKWYSLIPISVAFIIGAICGMSGVSPNDVIWLDILVAIVLIIMCDRKPKSNIDNDNDNIEIKKES